MGKSVFKTFKANRKNGEDVMKISVIISACDKRCHLFDRSLDTWASQTMSKNDFELIVVDDAIREDLYSLCKEKSKELGINIQFIRIDKYSSIIPVKSFIPVLTNNVGFKNALGDVVVITGPETLQASTNLEVSWSLNSRKECAYGLVYKANEYATDYIEKGWSKLKKLPLEHLLQIPGAKARCVTMPPHKPAYWYFMAVAKKYVYQIGGIDERFLGGLCGEDDDFANRMFFSNVTPVYEHRILGIHQDHTREDFGDNIHIDRRDGIGYCLWVHNFTLMQDNLEKKIFKANENYDWGSDSLITLHEFFGR